jgi:DNA-binding NtrC family response regulator/pSer/pThr/pTyr-binding forkhead associated (FHA) protein
MTLNSQNLTSMPASRLVIYRNNKAIRNLRIMNEDALLTIGRLPDLDIYLPDEGRKVSRIHAVIVRMDEFENGDREKRKLNQPPKKFFLRDLGSTQGTKINGDYVYKKILAYGDEIQIGDYILLFCEGDASAKTSDVLPLEELFKRLPVVDPANWETVSSEKQRPLQKGLSDSQNEFIFSLSRCGMGEDFVGRPDSFMSALLELLPADKSIVGFFENSQTYITFQQGLERESIHCSESFLNTLWKHGARQDEGSIWVPLNDKGFLGLIRTSLPPFTAEDLGFIRALFSYINTSNQKARVIQGKTVWPVSLVGLSDLKKRSIDIASMIDTTISDCLILGATGVGKEVLARFLHENSSRRFGSFITVNCAALPKEMAYGELFGYERGAFTGAIEAKKGYFEMAAGGTLFLDEIGDMPDSLQVSLLTALQQREITRLGGKKPIQVDVRIIAATDREVESKMKDESFRRALYERFAYRIDVPLLKDRRLDIPLLAYYFLDKYATTTRVLSREALQLLLDYDWPGNVRELHGVIQNVLMNPRKIIFSWDLPIRIRHAIKLSDYQEKIKKTLRETEREKIMEALEESRGNCTMAARILGISRSGFYVKLKEYKIPEEWGRKWQV